MGRQVTVWLDSAGSNGQMAEFVVTDPGDTQPSLFGGAPGFVDCDAIKVYCEMGGATGGVTGSGVVYPDGTLVLNPTPPWVSNHDDSMGKLKARFD